jgi:hypothetical protein
MEKRLQGKNLFLLYQNTVNKEVLLRHLKNILFSNGVRYILIGKDIFNILVFVCLENPINVRSGAILNFDGNEAKYKVSTDTSSDIYKLLQSNEVWCEGECDHPVYLTHKELRNQYEGKLQRQELEFSFKLKESEKEKEELRSNYEGKLQIQELEFSLKLKECEKEYNRKIHEKEKEKEELKNNYEKKLKRKEIEFSSKLQEKNEQTTEKLMIFFNNFKNECSNRNDSHFKTFIDENSKNLLLDISKISNNDIQNELSNQNESINQNELILISKENISLDITQNHKASTKLN